MSATIPGRPVIVWFGGKFLLAPKLARLAPPHEFFTEAYGGGGSFLMRKTRCVREVYNDLDGTIVNLFRVLRNRPQAMRLRKLLELTPFAREEYEAAFEPCDDPVELARRTVVRAFLGRSSAGATNDSSTSTCFCPHEHRARAWATYPAAVKGFVERLRGVIIENRPAIECIEQHDRPATFHYVDPPYVHDTRRRLDRGYRFEMSDDDHRQLASTLHACQGFVLLSGYRGDLYDELYRDWERRDLPLRDSSGQDRLESVWLNPKLSACQIRDLFSEAL